MPLTLERPETDRLAHDLAGLTGETVEDAVATALRDRLSRERQRRDREALLARCRAIIRAASSGPGTYPESEDPAAFLYDERGLPA